jgi:multimeric flavodoxin WrbA
MSKLLLIIYAGHSPTGSTATIAKWIAGNVIKKTGASVYVNVIIKAASDATAEDVDNADGIVLGSATYNGNPEQEMIKFVNNKLGAGTGEPVLAGKICGVFCTSAGYVSGAQPVLNGLARLAMTFGATFVGGGDWTTSQGVCGMVDDERDGFWKWDPSMENLQSHAEAYGERLGMITSFFNESYTNLLGSKPINGKVIICDKCDVIPKKHCDDNICWILVPATLLATVLFIVLVMKKNQYKTKQ